ncbi:MAG: hypothetical protein V1906_00570 [Candidatus Woesearchaeota archaeon]
MKPQKVTARIILEVMGMPKEHVEQALKDTIKKLKDDGRVRLSNAKTYETEQIEEFWSTFAEVEFEADDIKNVLDICFDYQPSTLEILEPAGVEVDTAYLASMFNDLLAKLHQYNAVVKNMEAEKMLMRIEIDKLSGNVPMQE